MISKWWQKEWSWHAPILKGAVLKDNQRDFEIEFFEGIVKRFRGLVSRYVKV